MNDWLIYAEVEAERRRAHRKHAETSMEDLPANDPTGARYRILCEEVGEVAAEFNDAAHDKRPVDLVMVRAELIQVAAMAIAWVDAIGKLPAAEYCDDMFNSEGFVFWHCTSRIGHPGNHAAVNGDSDVLAMWPNLTRKDHP